MRLGGSILAFRIAQAGSSALVLGNRPETIAGRSVLWVG